MRNDDAPEMVLEEKGGARRRESGFHRGGERGESPGTPGAGEENKGKARKMCLTWQRQFFSRSCRLNARRRKAIGSREEPVGKMAAISLQPPVQVSPPLATFHLLARLSLALPSALAATCERNPVRGIKGENTLRRLLFLLTV